MRFGELGSTEFLGPEDVIRPWRSPRISTHSVEIRWEVLAPLTAAVLDRDFATRIRPWPELTAKLLDRGSERVDTHMLHSALRQAVRVEDRVLLAMWHFAKRWGTETADGWTLKLPRLTGEVLANIVGARRQSVSTALGALADRRALRRTADGIWEITQRPSQLGNIETGQRASDHPHQLGLVANGHERQPHSRRAHSRR